MLHGLRVVRRGDRFRVLTDCRLESRPYDSKVRSEVVDTKGLHGKCGVRRHHVESLRLGALHATKEIGIERELQNRPTSCLLRKFRIGDLVRPRAEYARCLHTTKDVRPSEPLSVSKSGLKHDGDARAHGIRGPGDGVVTRVFAEVNNFESFVAERLDVVPLVLESALLEKDERRIDPGGSGP